jgi:hypothetical protein
MTSMLIQNRQFLIQQQYPASLMQNWMPKSSLNLPFMHLSNDHLRMTIYLIGGD